MQSDPFGAFPFSFAQLRDFAMRDPEEFERWRAELLEAFIDDAPARVRQRLRARQWRIDAQQRRDDSHYGTLIHVQAELLQAVESLHANLAQLAALVAGQGEDSEAGSGKDAGQ